MSPKRILNVDLPFCPIVHNFFIDFRKKEPVPNFRLNRFLKSRLTFLVAGFYCIVNASSLFDLEEKSRFSFSCGRKVEFGKFQVLVWLVLV